MRSHSPEPTDAPSLKASSIIAVTRAMVHQRTRELTVIAGRPPQQVRQADYEQAMCEVTGETDGDRQQAVLDAVRVDYGTAHLFAQHDRS